MTKSLRHHVTWKDAGREPQCEPNPEYPDGVALNIASGAPEACLVELPYPAPRCGYWAVECQDCGLRVGVTAAGRRDDPRSITVPCKKGNGS